MDVGAHLAARRARRIECVVCGRLDCSEVVDRRVRNRDVFEQLRCTAEPMGGPSTFRRIWINR